MNERQKPYRTSAEEQNLRWEYGSTNMTIVTFNRRYEKLKKVGKILRSGKVVTK